MVIWTILISLLLVSVMTAVLFWVQCLPPSAIWDPRVKGRCILKITPFSVLLGGMYISSELCLVFKLTVKLSVWCIVADFALALLPWLFLWPLNMGKSEKLTIAGSLSLGVMSVTYDCFVSLEITADWQYR